MTNKTDYVWHVWINQEADRLRKWEADNPTGVATTETRRGKPVEVPTRPRTPLDLVAAHDRKLYDFKAAMQMLPWLAKRITQERTKSLPLIHQQCSHSAPESLTENFLTCGLGKKLRDCPILIRLRDTFDQERGRTSPDGRPPYYAGITDEQVDEVAAMTCVWHMLMGTDSSVDWQEGAVQDVSDRMYWERLYANLAGAGEQPERATDGDTV